MLHTDYQQKMTPENGADNLEIRRLVIRPTEFYYETPYQRSMRLNANENNVSKLRNAMSIGGQIVKTVTPHSMSSKLSGVFELNALPSTDLGKIENGWSSHRLLFLLQVRHHTSIPGSYYDYYIQGYTDGYDPSVLSGRLDEYQAYNMNTITTVSTTKDPVDGKLYSNIVETYNIINKKVTEHTNFSEFDILNNNGYSAIRPEDLLADISTYAMTEGNPAVNHHSAVGHITGSVMTSAKSNNNPTHYGSKILNAHVMGRNMTSIGEVDPFSAYDTAASLTAESTIHDNPFVYKLYEMTGSPDVIHFTLNQLRLITPHLPQVTTVCQPGEIISEQDINKPIIMDSNVTENMLNSTYETLTVQEIISSTSAVMSENYLTELSFGVKIDMTSLHDKYIVTPTSANSMIENLDIRGYIERVKVFIASNLIPKISEQGQIWMELYCHIDIFGSSTVSITTVNTKTPVLYRMPEFASSLYNANMSTVSYKNALVADVGDLLTDLS